MTAPWGSCIAVSSSGSVTHSSSRRTLPETQAPTLPAARKGENLSDGNGLFFLCAIALDWRAVHEYVNIC